MICGQLFAGYDHLLSIAERRGKPIVVAALFYVELLSECVYRQRKVAHCDVSPLCVAAEIFQRCLVHCRRAQTAEAAARKVGDKLCGCI